MRISNFKVAIPTVIIALAGIINLTLGNLMTDSVIIHSSGSLRYVGEARPLHVEGRYIKDDLNKTVFLRGINKPTFSAYTDGWWQPEGGTYAWGVGVWDPDAVAYNLDKMKELLEANIVRLHLHVGYWIDNADNYREHLKTVASLASDRGMYILLSGFNNGDGGGAGGQSFMPYPSSRLLDAEAYINWIAGDTDSLSSEFYDFPNVLYGFWNEPVGDQETRRGFFNACQEIIARLRAKGDNHLVVYQFGYTGMESNSDVFNNATQGWGILQGTNIVYSVHTYRWIRDHYTYFGYDDYNYSRVEDVMLSPYNPPISNGLGIQALIDNGLPWGNFEYGAAIGGQYHVPEEDQWREIEWYRNLHLFMNNYLGSYTAWLWWDTSRNYPLLQDSAVYPWCPPLNEPGGILRDSIAAGQP